MTIEERLKEIKGSLKDLQAKVESGDADAIKQHFSQYLQKLRESPHADGAERIYTHGEKEVLAAADRRENGIPVNDGTMVELADLCDYLHLDFGSYFSDYEPPKSMVGFAGNY